MNTDNNDWLSHFIDDCCIVEKGKYARAGELYAAYREWAIRNGGFARSHTAFPAEMKKKGFKGVKTRIGKIWFGISLIPKSQYL